MKKIAIALLVCLMVFSVKESFNDFLMELLVGFELPDPGIALRF